MTSVKPVHPRQLLRRLNTATLPVVAAERERKPADILAIPPEVPVKSFLGGKDGLVRHGLMTGATALGAAATLPGLVASTTLQTSFWVASMATCATVFALAGTLIGLFSAHELGNLDLLDRRSLRWVPCLAVGIAVGVLVGAQGALTVVGAVCLGLGLTTVGYISAVRTGRAHVSLNASAAILAAAIVIGPTGWLVAGGYGAQCALSAAVCASSGTLSVCALIYGAMQMLQRSPPTALVDDAEKPEVVEQARLEGLSLGDEPPTIFNVPPEFSALAKFLGELKEQQGAVFTGFKGLCVATLYGPPGSGKTFSAAGLAQSLGGMFVACDNSTLNIDDVTSLPEAYMNLVTLLMEAQLKASQSNRPVVVLVDEVDALLPRADGKNDTKAFNDVAGVVLLTAACSLIASGRTPIVLLMATNHPENIAPVLERISSRKPIFMGVPDEQGMRKILSTSLNFLRRDLADRDIPHGDLNKRPEMDQFSKRLHALNLTGRALRGIQDTTLLLAFNKSRDSSWLALADEDKRQAIDYCIISGIDHALTTIERQGSHKEVNDKYARLSGKQTVEEVEKLMEKMGLKDLNPLEVVRRISEQLLGNYVDPSQGPALSLLASRSYITVAQLGLIYIGQRLSRPEARDITDVKPNAASNFFGGSNMKGMTNRILNDTWRDVKHAMLPARFAG